MATPAVVRAGPPSTFAALFRRSKFASFDLAVAQVYRSYDGEAFRGNWGLKRPLAARRRSAMITVEAVDSRYQQTEWSSGESQARMVKKFEELDVDVVYEPIVGKQWAKKMGSIPALEWMVDSDLAPPLTEEDKPRRPRGHAVPNIHAMSDKQFQKYLRKLRDLRPKFREYLKSQVNAVTEDTPMYELAQMLKDQNRHRAFISAHAAEQYDSMDSRNMEQLPHRSAGLVYSHTPPMQTFLTTKPKPGIILQSRAGRTRRKDEFLTSFAGTASISKKDGAVDKPLFRFNTTDGLQRDRIPLSVGQFRLKEIPQFDAAPTVVGHARIGLHDTCIVTKTGQGEHLSRKNPHFPGTRDYVAMEKVHSSGDKPPARNHVRPMKDSFKKLDAATLLKKLESSIKKAREFAQAEEEV
jgi:hypothetical protein